VARLAVALAACIIVSACSGAGAPSQRPTPRPTPVVTPDPHLQTPASADDVFRALSLGGLQLTANNAVSGRGEEPVKRINATYQGWPLAVEQYSSNAALSKVTKKWKDGDPPGRGEPPVAISGMNILVIWGTARTNKKPKTADARKAEAGQELVDVLHPLLSPLRARANVPLRLSTTAATASSDPSQASEAEPAP
jgi:hypothetical protein